MGTLKQSWILTVAAMLLGASFMSNPALAEKKRAPAKAAPARKGGTAVSEEGDFVVEKRSDGTTVKYKKKQTYDFEGASVDGVYNKPSGSYISNIKDVKGRSIIRIRENFDPEVIDSSRSVR